MSTTGDMTGGSELENFQQKIVAVNVDKCEEYEHLAPPRTVINTIWLSAGRQRRRAPMDARNTSIQRCP